MYKKKLYFQILVLCPFQTRSGVRLILMEESEVRTILHLRSRFFEMPRHEAIKDFDIYKRADQHARSLSDFYEVCKGLELARNFQFSVLRELIFSDSLYFLLNM
ncbi:putative clathrin assembly protein At2g01600 isoform X6 [Rutidosis leptorrhynchoides]|uniref:putative clathrin assembly protein At2g01600 isoform X6 n=1 Tax=Rutidosis leptorrhynchoides TaxID=125765 RepID=UPI003A9A26D8